MQSFRVNGIWSKKVRITSFSFTTQFVRDFFIIVVDCIFCVLSWWCMGTWSVCEGCMTTNLYYILLLYNIFPLIRGATISDYLHSCTSTQTVSVCASMFVQHNIFFVFGSWERKTEQASNDKKTTTGSERERKRTNKRTYWWIGKRKPITCWHHHQKWLKCKSEFNW